MRSVLLSLSMRAPLLARPAIPHPHQIRNNACISLKRPPSVQLRQRHISSAASSVAAAAATPVAPKAESGVVVVVGGGIIGLSTTRELLQRGHRVVTVTKSDSPHSTTSAVAAGFVFPYLLKPISKCEEWVKLTVEHCKNPPKPEFVGPLRAFAIHVQDVVDGEPEWGQCGLDYRRMDASELTTFNNKREGWVPAIDGFVVETFWINTAAYLDWLVEDIKGLGGTLLPSKELSSLMDVTSDPDICSSSGGGGTNKVQAIVNCTGVYARNFVGDEDVFPVYGQVISLKPQAGIDDCYVVEDGADILGGHAYVVPRGDKIVCGGTAIADKWDEEPDKQITEGITKRVKQLVPELKLDESLIQEVRCGLRPARSELRLEAEPDHGCGVPVVHSYGHGGSGWTVFKGAARDAAQLVEKAIHQESRHE